MVRKKVCQVEVDDDALPDVWPRIIYHRATSHKAVAEGCIGSRIERHTDAPLQSLGAFRWAPEIVARAASAFGMVKRLYS